MEKTNVMRLFDARCLAYEAREYDAALVNGNEVAKALSEDPDCVFKTLVCQDAHRNHFVFVIPVNAELDLKKAAKAAGCKSIALIPQKELLPLTGYVHGGCSPFGMKKHFATFVDESAELFSKIYVSGGRRGTQIGISPDSFSAFFEVRFIDLTTNLSVSR